MSYYAHEPPQKLKPDVIAKLADCAASLGTGSQLPVSALDRWKAARVALESVLVSGHDIEKAVKDNTGWLDPVQTDLVRELVANGVAVLGAEDAIVEFDPDDNISMVPHPTLNAFFDSMYQVEVTDPNNTQNRERLKIRSGKRPTSEAEAAVLLEGGEPDATYADLMLATGTIEPIELNPEDRTRIIDELAPLAETQTKGATRTPGLHCYQCSRIARCGQFPPPDGYRVLSRDRTLRLSKTDLLNLGVCDRRTAWKTLHGLPKEDNDLGNAASATGLLFHDFVARATMSDDQDAEFEECLQEVSPDERAKLERLYERHKEVETGHVAVDVTRVEYEIGVTIPASGQVADSNGRVRSDAPVYVVVIARADGVGREQNGTPAVIEHRTGKNSDRIDERETALYAVATARLLRVDRVAVHQHALGAEGDPVCERIVYDADRLAEAETLLSRTVEDVVQWHPLDASAPSFSVGQWCSVCPFENRCQKFR